MRIRPKSNDISLPLFVPRRKKRNITSHTFLLITYFAPASSWVSKVHSPLWPINVEPPSFKHPNFSSLSSPASPNTTSSNF